MHGGFAHHRSLYRGSLPGPRILLVTGGLGSLRCLFTRSRAYDHFGQQQEEYEEGNRML